MEIDTLLIISLVTLSLLASVISASIGMGGMLMLAGMYALIKDMAIILPIHACVSGVSNITRITTYYKFIHLQAFRYFIIGSIPGLLAGSFLLYFLLPIRMQVTPYIMIAIGVFVVSSLAKKNKANQTDMPMRKFMVLGICAAPISLIFGANGAVISPYLIRKDMPRQTVVATSTAFQLSTHLLKLFIFYFLWQSSESTDFFVIFYNKKIFTLVILMVAAAFLGTMIGRSITDKISENKFKFIYFSMIYIFSAKFIILDGVLKII